MVKAGEEVRRRARPGCVSEPRPGEEGAAKQGCCELPNPAAGEPGLPLTGSRWR
jgi:hypothetical protein